ncbi:hypothetical protein ACF1HJ_09290 [Streptomyces sp. NPDC013978]|uniref:hypothetical protein n=1 Tax=Streptomyces sp. NPDC013978 TaxID=3364869 RepID=UPI0036FCB301
MLADHRPADGRPGATARARRTGITYAALDAAADRVANLLVARGIQPGEAGVAVVPLNVLLGPSSSSTNCP